jgi:pimeloyl-ACP methyl ester carboxylesterase
MKQYLIKNSGYAVRYQALPGVEPPLVFLHGLGCASSFEYCAVMAQPALLGRRALLIDLLGAGYSDQPRDFGYTVEEHAAYLNDMLRSLDLQQIVLFGHSLGGAVAICLAGLLQERLFSLILTESNLDPSHGRAVSHKIGTQSSEVFLSHGYTDLLTLAQKRNPLWGAALAHWLPQAVWRISRSAIQSGSPSWREQLYDLAKPKAYLFGERTLPSTDVDALREHGVRVEIIPNAGHSMALENPAALASTIAAIIHDCPGAR